jgi:hypothetical protein
LFSSNLWKVLGIVFALHLCLCERGLGVLQSLRAALDSHFLLMQSIDDDLGPSRRNRSDLQILSELPDL